MRFSPLFRLALSLVSAGSLLLGCGAASGVSGVAIEQVAGGSVATLGLDQAGESPAVLTREDGSMILVYVGGRSGDRRLFWAQSASGLSFDKAKAVDAHDFSDQEPCLVEADGVVHLFFASNRDGVDYALYHSRLEDGEFTAPERIDGFEGLAGLAVIYSGGHFTLAAEEMGAGLLVAKSEDGADWGEPTPVTNMGFEPALCAMPDGEVLFYTHAGQVFCRREVKGAWSAEVKAATGADRLRTPSAVWAGDHGELVYAERVDMRYQLRAERFDEALRFTEGRALPQLGREAKTPAICGQQNNGIALAWGMKSTSGQQGIALAVLDDDDSASH